MRPSLCAVKLLAIFAAGTPVFAQIYEVTTLAGDATYRSRDGTGASARFQGPTGIAVDRQGNVFVADSGNHTIRKITAAGVVTTFAGQAGVAGTTDGAGRSSTSSVGNVARFSGPRGLAFDPNGNLFVTDTENHTIRKITSDGTVSTYAGTAGSGGHIDGIGGTVRLNRPWAIAVDTQSNVFVSEPDTATIRKITPDGRTTTLAGSVDDRGSADGLGSAARFERPFGLAIDRSGNLYVADGSSGSILGRPSVNHTIRKITPEGLVTTLAGLAGSPGSADGTGSLARFNTPLALAIDDIGNLFVADSGNRTVRRITPTGIVTTLAGAVGLSDSADGPGPQARFSLPTGIAFGPDGSAFVTDGGANNTIRKITVSSLVTTLAGQANSLSPQSIDGPAQSAQFTAPGRLTVDPAGNIYVADRNVIRKVSPTGVVSTLTTPDSFLTIGAVALDQSGQLLIGGDGRIVRASLQGSISSVTLAGSLGLISGLAVDVAGNILIADSGGRVIRRITPAGVASILAGRTDSRGSNDGVGSAALFGLPTDIASDREGNVYVADQGDYTIRKVTPTGVVTTFAGLSGAAGTVDGSGAAARFASPGGLAFDAAGNLLVADGPTIRRISPAGEVVTIVGSPGNRGFTDGIGSAARLAASGLAIGTDGTIYISEFTNQTLRRAVALANPARLINFSILADLADAGETMTVGTIIGGQGTRGGKPVLVRAAGPTLSAFGVNRPLPDPFLEFYTGSSKIAENDNWGGASGLGTVAARVGAFAFPNPASTDSALSLPAISSGNHSMIISTRATAGGSVLAELYDATPGEAFSPTSPRLVNVSVLKSIGPGLTAGFVIGGVGVRPVLIRAIGPSLAAFGVTRVLNDPALELFDAQSRLLASNDNWSGTEELSQAFAQVGAFSLNSPNSRDAALLTSLAPGAYTVRIRSTDAVSNGTALVEIYEVP